MVFQEARPEHIGHGRSAHGHSGMPGIGFLNAIDGKKTDGIDAKLVEFGLTERLFPCDSVTIQGIRPPQRSFNDLVFTR
jgi:hypothetical protein